MPEQFGPVSIRGFIPDFYQALEGALASMWWPKICFSATGSRQKTEHYRWLGQAPMMRKWVAGRHPQGLRVEAYTLDNEKFEATLDVENDDLNRGLGSQIRVRIQEMADGANEYPQMLASGVIDLGTSALCYDGQPFFDAAHPGTTKVAAQKNLLTAAEVPALNVGTPAQPTPVEMTQAVLGCIGYMYGLKDDQGRPMNGAARNFLLMVPVSLWLPAVGPANISLGSNMTGLADNPLLAAAGKMGINLEIVPNPYLDWTVDFALFRTDGRAKPLIWQEEYPIQISTLGADSEYCHTNDRQQFGIKRSCNVGFGYWQHALKGTLS
jgi:phage major head subunit gpT-like protein